jgi:acyl carrier protein
MDNAARLLKAIYDGIDDYNMDIPESDQLEKAPVTILFDSEGKLDSVGFVTLSVAIENRILKEFGQAIPLFTQEAFNRPDKPLKTVQSLSVHLTEKLQAL